MKSILAVMIVVVLLVPAYGSSASFGGSAMETGVQQRLRSSTITLAALPLLLGTSSVAQELASLGPGPCLMAQYVSIATQDTARPGQTPQPKVKSEGAALQYSVIGTLVPTATLVLAYPGLLFGPSLGYFYADEPGRAWKGIGIRALATGGMASAFVICGWDCGSGDSEYNIAWAVFLSSAGAFVGSAIYDIATVESAVRRHNSQVLQTAWALTPTYSARDRALGLRLKLTF